MKRLETIRYKWKQRFDADEDKVEDGKKGAKYHGGGNVRLAYGLCKGAGIDTTGMSPSEAWEAYEGKTGVSASEAYSEHFGDKKKKNEGAKKESVADGYKKKAKELISKKVSEKEFNDFLVDMGNDENLSDSDFYDLYESSIKDWKKSFGAKIDETIGEKKEAKKETPKEETKPVEEKLSKPEKKYKKIIDDYISSDIQKEKFESILDKMKEDDSVDDEAYSTMRDYLKDAYHKKFGYSHVPEWLHEYHSKSKLINQKDYGLNKSIEVSGLGKCVTSKRVDERAMEYKEIGDEDWTPFTEHKYSKKLYEIKDKSGNKYVYDFDKKKIIFNGSATQYEDDMYDASEDSYLEAGGDLYKKYGDDYEDEDY